jgi:hypothetical protein
MRKILFTAALAGLIACTILLVGSDANATPLRNIILVTMYVTCAALATHNALEVRHETH